jgi:hypothetical protein
MLVLKIWTQHTLNRQGHLANITPNLTVRTHINIQQTSIQLSAPPPFFLWLPYGDHLLHEVIKLVPKPCFTNLLRAHMWTCGYGQGWIIPMHITIGLASYLLVHIHPANVSQRISTLKMRIEIWYLLVVNMKILCLFKWSYSFFPNLQH